MSLLRAGRKPDEIEVFPEVGIRDGRNARWTKLGAWAGIVGPLMFTATYMLQEAFRTDEYSPLAETVSALEAGPYGWAQQVNFVVFGLLTLAFANGIHRQLPQTLAAKAGSALFYISGLGLLLAAVFPLRQDASGATFDPGGHMVAGTMFFLSSALALIVLARGIAADPVWRNVATNSLVAGAAALAGFILMRVLVVPDDAPLHGWAGLAQRMILLLFLFPGRLVLSVKLLQTARAGASS